MWRTDTISVEASTIYNDTADFFQIKKKKQPPEKEQRTSFVSDKEFQEKPQNVQAKH